MFDKVGEIATAVGLDIRLRETLGVGPTGVSELFTLAAEGVAEHAPMPERRTLEALELDYYSILVGAAVGSYLGQAAIGKMREEAGDHD